MLNIKVQYKGKIINLGRKIDSLEKIHQEMKARFPLQFKYGAECYYNLQKMQNFDEVIQLVNKLNVSSIKLKVLPKERAQSELKEQNKQFIRNSMRPQQTTIIHIDSEKRIRKSSLARSGSFLSDQQGQGQAQIEKLMQKKIKIQSIEIQPQIKNSSKILVPQRKVQGTKNYVECQVNKRKKIQQKAQSFLKVSSQNKLIKVQQENPSKRISIFNAYTQQQYDQKSVLTSQKKPIFKKVQVSTQVQKTQLNLSQKRIQYICVNCSGTGKFSPGVECQLCLGTGCWNQQNKFLGLLKNLINEQINKKIAKNQERFPKYNVQTNYNFQLIETQRIFKKQLGDKFDWTIKIKNTGQRWLHNMFIISQQTGDVIDVGKINSKQNKIVNLGSFECSKLGKNQKNYKLGYYDSLGQFKQIGSKFEYIVHVVAKDTIIITTDNFKNRIINLSKKLKLNKHSVEFFISMFKQVGIYQLTHKQMNQQTLSDMLVIWNDK